jgi:hypothetical protein
VAVAIGGYGTLVGVALLALARWFRPEFEAWQRDVRTRLMSL